MDESLKDQFENPRPCLKLWVTDDKGNRTKINAESVMIFGEDHSFGTGGFVSIGLPLEDDGTFEIRFRDQTGNTRLGDAPATVDVDRKSAAPIKVTYNNASGGRAAINFDEHGHDRRSAMQRLFARFGL
jgi:hypothetical protein